MSFRSWILAALCLAPAACNAAPRPANAEWMSEGGVVVLDGSAEALLLQVRALGTDAQGRSVPVCAGCNGPFVDDHFVHASWCPYYEPEPTTWWRSARKVIFGILVVAGAVFLCILVIGGVAG